jgi:hypothetical protein
MRERAARAAEGRRRSRREEWATQTALAEMLPRYLADTVFWTALENAPRSLLSGLLAKRRGTRAGLPDLMLIFRRRPAVFVELKSRVGIPSRAQKQIRQELVAVGCAWWMARSARAALTALHRSGVPFRRLWRPPALKPWEGPFDGSEKRLPRHPAVAARRREYARRWRERQRARALEARSQPAASDAAWAG